MSQSLPMLGITIGGVTGIVAANMANVPGPVGYAVAALGAIGGLGLWYWSDLPVTAGFGAPAGPGPAPPKWINVELGTAVYENGDRWRVVHPESGLEAVADDAQEAADELHERLEENGWVTES